MRAPHLLRLGAYLSRFLYHATQVLLLMCRTHNYYSHDRLRLAPLKADAGIPAIQILLNL